ncbi:MAG: sugar ABC transporter substrate-binding protein [bacterium]
MDDKKNNDNLQQPSEVSQPIYETVPVDSYQPEEIASNVEATDQTDFSQVQPEIAPLEAEPTPLIVKEPSKLPILLGGIAVFVIVFIIFFAILISGSKKKALPSAQTISLTYWGLWEEKEVMEPMIKEYQKTHPNIQITYEKKSEKDYRKKLITWINNGQGPDIFRFHNTWIPELRLPDPNTQQLVLSALPESVMPPSVYEKTFYPVHVKDLKIGNNIYGIPLMVDGMVMFVNEDLLKKAGISSVPTNWDEMVAAASQVVVKGKDNTLITAGFAAGTATNIAHFSDIFGLMLLLNGGDLAKLDQPEASGALEAYRRFAEEPNNVWSETMPNSITAFAEGKVAMIFAPSWELLTIKTTAPDLKIAIVPIPNPPGGKQFSIASYWVEGVSRKSTHQQAAWEFLAYLSSKEGQTKMYEIQSSMRMFGAPYSRMDLADLLIQDPYLGPVVKQAAEDRFISLPLTSNTFDDGLNDEIIRYLENAINSASQGVSYGEAMKKAKEGVDQIFLQYKIK